MQLLIPAMLLVSKKAWSRDKTLSKQSVFILEFSCRMQGGGCITAYVEEGFHDHDDEVSQDESFLLEVCVGCDNDE